MLNLTYTDLCQCISNRKQVNLYNIKAHLFNVEVVLPIALPANGFVQVVMTKPRPVHLRAKRCYNCE